MNDVVSVVLPLYNYEKYVVDAIKSVMAQSHEAIELVVLDDQSTDGGYALAQEFLNSPQCRSRFCNILMTQNAQNEGAHATINKAVSLASGDYVAILNTDDLYEPNRFALMIDAMKAEETRWAFSGVSCIDAVGEPLHTPQAEQFSALQQRLCGQPFTALAAVAENVCVSTGNLLMEKSLMDELGPFTNYKYVHDYEYFLRACLVCEPSFVSTTHYLYRLHGENSFTKLAKEGLRENRVVWLDFYRNIQKGSVTNSVMRLTDYRTLTKSAVYAEGKKKAMLWRLSGNPLFMALLKIYKKLYQMQ